MSQNIQSSMDVSNVAALALNTHTLGIKENLRQILQACYEAKAKGKMALFCGELSVTGCDCQDMFLSPGFIKRVKRELREFASQLPENFIVGVGLPLYLGEDPLGEPEDFNLEAYANLHYQIKDQSDQACDSALDLGKDVNFVASSNESLPDAEKVANILRASGTVGFDEDEAYAPRSALKSKLLVNAYTILERNKVVQTISSKLTLDGTPRMSGNSRYFAQGCQLENLIDPESYIVNWKNHRFVVAMGQLRAIKDVLHKVPELQDELDSFSFIVLPQAHVFCATENEQCLVNNAVALAQEFKLPVIQINNLGADGGSAIYDGRCFFISKDAQILACNQRFSFRPYELVDNSKLYKSAPHVYDHMLQAVALGLFDWMKKTYSKGFALSMSGGADSALCSVCVGLSQVKALLDLGLIEYVDTLKALHIKFDEAGFTEACKAVAGMGPYESVLNQMQLDGLIAALKKYVMPQVLVCVYQGSKYSGNVTFNAAKLMAEDVGASFYQWSIAPMVEQYVNTVSDAVGYELNWQTDDIALQNIQARSRLPSIWLMANHKGYLLLATSNLSEAAVGYCTMDGDTAGGLSPIAGIGKSVILKINKRILNQGIGINGYDLTYRIPAIQYIVAQAPTAELRPGGEQTDEKDLMPYPLLDVIRQLFVVEGLLPEEIVKLLISKKDTVFAEVTVKLGLSDEDIERSVYRFFRLFQRNQWKRERFATGFRVEYDDASPKSFLHFPVLNDPL